MARIFDVIEYPSEMPDEIVHHFPETGIADIRWGSQLIVRESQNAIFMRDGKALDVFGPGRHTLSTANLPLLTNLLGKAFNNRTPFTAEVYYVAMREFADRKWGTAQPIIIQNAGVGLGMTLLQGFGSYSFQVADPQQFVTQIVGATSSYSLTSIENRLRSMLLSKLQDTLATQAAAGQNIFQLLSLTEELGTAVRAKAQDDFAAIGLTLKSFYIANLKPSETSAEDLRAMGMLDMNTYTQLQAADAMRDAAKNEGGGAGLTAGIGAGMGIGNYMTQAFGMNQQQPVQQQAAPAAAAPAAPAATPSVMTPSEVAQMLKVAEEDIIAAIQEGDLKARKIGSAYRISKEAVEEFLKG